MNLVTKLSESQSVITKKEMINIDLVGINLFDLSVNKVINQFMAFLGLCI